jgi:hypothetical protein
LREVTAEERWDLNLPLIERGVLDSPIGFELSFEELSAFASRIAQVIDGLFVGYVHPRRNSRRSDDDATILENAEMLVAAVDSSFWLVSAPAPVAERFEHRFQKVSEADSDVGLSTWGRE